MTEKKFGITEGVVLAVVPAFGYWLAYLYELGYCKFFDIPEFFIDVDWVNVVSALLAVIGAYAIFHPIAEIFHSFISPLSTVVKSVVAKILFTLAIVSGLAVVDRLTLKQFIGVIVLFVLPLVFIELILPVLFHRKVPGYMNKLEKQRELDFKTETLVDKLAEKIGRNWFLGLAIIYIVSNFSYFSGGYSAKTKNTFVILPGNPEFVVLKQYKDYYVTAELDRGTHDFYRRYSIVPMVNESREFSVEKIGEIKPKQQ